jgi:transcriptional regulator with XRE-family HTH domain
VNLAKHVSLPEVRVLRLKFLRIERKLSQQQLAAATRYIVPQPELSRIESSRTNPTDREPAALACVLGCAPDASAELHQEG